MNLSHCRKLFNRFEIDACGNDGRVTQEKEENQIFEITRNLWDRRLDPLFWRFSPGLLILSFICKIQQRVIKLDSAGAVKESLRLFLDIYPELAACNCQVYKDLNLE